MSSAPPEQRPSPAFEAEGWEGGAHVSDWEPLRLLGKSMIDYMVDYYQRVEDFPVRPDVEPGYLKVHVRPPEKSDDHIRR